LTVAIWGKPDQICSMRDFLRMTHLCHPPPNCCVAQRGI
jgi:hypothetical protein